MGEALRVSFPNGEHDKPHGLCNIAEAMWLLYLLSLGECAKKNVVEGCLSNGQETTKITSILKRPHNGLPNDVPFADFGAQSRLVVSSGENDIYAGLILAINGGYSFVARPSLYIERSIWYLGQIKTDLRETDPTGWILGRLRGYNITVSIVEEDGLYNGLKSSKTPLLPVARTILGFSNEPSGLPGSP